MPSSRKIAIVILLVFISPLMIGLCYYTEQWILFGKAMHDEMVSRKTDGNIVYEQCYVDRSGLSAGVLMFPRAPGQPPFGHTQMYHLHRTWNMVYTYKGHSHAVMFPIDMMIMLYRVRC